MIKLDKINSLLGTLSNLGVILGIIFLLIELNQNNELLAAQDRFNRLTIAQQSGYMLAQDSELRAIIIKAFSGNELTTNESLAAFMYWDQTWKGYEWTFRELQREDLPIERWRSNFGSSPVLLELWNATKNQYRTEFVDFIDSEIIGRQ